MPWDFGAGVAAAAGAGAGLIGDSIKRERNLEDATNLEALKQKTEQDKQARIAAVLNGVSRTKDVPIAGPTEDGSSLGTTQQAKPEAEYRRERGDALTKAGLIDLSEREYAAADRHEDKTERAADRDEDRKVRAAAQKSADEKWQEQLAENKRQHKERMAQLGQAAGLKAQESKEFNTTVDSYVTGKAKYDELVASKADPKDIAIAKQNVEKNVLKLKQFRVDVSEVGSSADKLSLATALNSANKTIKDLDGATDPKSVATKERAEEARDALLKRIGQLAGGESGDKGMSDIDRLLPPKEKDSAGGGKPAAGMINEQLQASANLPKVNIYGSKGAMERRRAELERIIGDGGIPRAERKNAEDELARMN